MFHFVSLLQSIVFLIPCKINRKSAKNETGNASIMKKQDLTPKGKEYLAAMNTEWENLLNTLSDLKIE